MVIYPSNVASQILIAEMRQYQETLSI